MNSYLDKPAAMPGCRTDVNPVRHRLSGYVRAAIVLCGAAVALAWPGGTVHAQQCPVRERVRLDDRWQFIREEPAQITDALKYANVKAFVGMTGADLQAAASALDSLPPPPDGHPGEDVPYARPSFDDHSWRTLNLPHDRGIEGPFKQEDPGETGKLPWSGVGWYRKHFRLPASDNGKQVFLQIDGAMCSAARRRAPSVRAASISFR